LKRGQAGWDGGAAAFVLSARAASTRPRIPAHGSRRRFAAVPASTSSVRAGAELAPAAPALRQRPLDPAVPAESTRAPFGFRRRGQRPGFGVERPPREPPKYAAAPPAHPVWLLDLDNTLHDALPSIMPRINRAMTEFVMRRLELDEPAASALRVHYWRRYGATMLGMIRHHDVDPHEFLRETHPFPDLHRLVRRDVRLMHLLRRLPGRKLVVTNAPAEYAGGVIAALGIAPLLDGVIAIEQMRFAGQLRPKPSRPMLRKLLARVRLPAWRCVLVEDTVENLRSARHCGVRTVWVSGISYRARPCWQRPRGGHGGIDLHVKTVVQLARTPFARPYR